jgi:uncharacterized protein YprB with RNaseH-like and TPR domain
MLEGRQIVVIDLEVLHSPDACLHCGHPASAHGDSWSGQSCPRQEESPWTCYERIGWDNHLALGLSIGCTWDYQDSMMHWFDQHTAGALIEHLLTRNACLVTFNGRTFDGPLLGAVADVSEDVRTDWTQYVERESYDLLREIWAIDPARKFERGLNSLDALCKANGLPAKEMDGAQAPRLWAQGRVAEVLTYCQGDVLRTKALFEMVVEGTPLLRGDGLPISLPTPKIP